MSRTPIDSVEYITKSSTLKTSREWKKKNPNRVQEYSKLWCKNNPQYKQEWRKKNPKKHKRHDIRSSLKRKYGITEDKYTRLFVSQGRVCAICRKPDTVRLSVDHDHNFNAVRGLLCRACNRGIGMLQDNPILLKSAESYLYSLVSNTLIVGIGCKARSGKNTLAKFIHARIPMISEIFAFADAMKSYARINHFMGSKDGPLLQTLGTDLFRHVDPDIWVRTLALRINEEQPKVAIITDMRFPNEKEWVERYGFSVRVNRLQEDGKLYIASDRSSDHLSEIVLDGVIFDLEYSAKSGDMLSLEKAADDIVKKIFEMLPKDKGIIYGKKR